MDLIGVLDNTIKRIYSDSLYRNGIYLLLSSAITNGLGFVFWIVAARLYPAASIGLNTAAISAAMLISSLSNLGINQSLVRFLPIQGDSARQFINSSLTFVGIVAIILLVIFLSGMSVWLPALLPIFNQPIYVIALALLAVLQPVLSLAGQASIARHKSNFVFIQNAIVGFVKLAALLLLATSFADFGILSSWGIAMLLTFPISILLFVPKSVPGYRFSPSLNKDILKDITKYSFANYLADILWMSPAMILPLLITNILGTVQNAYFFIAWNIVNVIAAIPIALSTSLFAEGANEAAYMAGRLRKCVSAIATILIPVVIMVVCFADIILLLFGAQYSENSTNLLRVIALSTIPLSINLVYIYMMRIQNEMRGAIGVAFTINFITIFVSIVLLPKLGVLGAALAWLSAQIIPAGVILFTVGWKRWMAGKSHVS